MANNAGSWMGPGVESREDEGLECLIEFLIMSKTKFSDPVKYS